MRAPPLLRRISARSRISTSPIAAADDPEVHLHAHGAADRCDGRPHRDAQTGEATTIAKGESGLRIGQARLFATSATRLVAENGTVLEWSGADRVTVSDAQGNVDTLVRTTAASPGATQLAELAGAYVSDEAETTLVAAVDGNGLVLKRRPETVIRLTPIYPDAFTGSIGTSSSGARRDASWRWASSGSRVGPALHARGPTPPSPHRGTDCPAHRAETERYERHLSPTQSSRTAQDRRRGWRHGDRAGRGQERDSPAAAGPERRRRPASADAVVARLIPTDATGRARRSDVGPLHRSRARRVPRSPARSVPRGTGGARSLRAFVARGAAFTALPPADQDAVLVDLKAARPARRGPVPGQLRAVLFARARDTPCRARLRPLLLRRQRRLPSAGIDRLSGRAHRRHGRRGSRWAPPRRRIIDRRDGSMFSGVGRARSQRSRA